MVRKAMKNKNKGKNKTKGKRKPKASGKKRSGLPKPVVEYMKLVDDPCNGPLVRAIGSDSGGSIIERARSVVSFPLVAGNTNGYLAWFPGFTNPAGVNNGPGCCYYYENSAAGTPPNNTVADPMGTVAQTSGVFLADPCAALIGGTSPFSRAKATAACMQLYSSSQISIIQGQVAYVARMSLAAFDMNNGLPGTVIQPPSVNQLLAYAAKRERYGLDGHELKWAPTERECQLRTNGTAAQGSQISDHQEPDACFWRGVANTRETRVACPDPNNVYGIVFVWSAVYGANVNQNHITLTKVSELELAPRSGAIEPPPAGRTSPSVPGFESVNEVIDILDSVAPEWRTQAKHAAVSMTASAIGAVYTGAQTMGLLRGPGQNRRMLMDSPV